MHLQDMHMLCEVLLQFKPRVFLLINWQAKVRYLGSCN